MLGLALAAVPVRLGEPCRQLPSGIIRGSAIERHHGGWDSRRTGELCAPAIADEGDLDLVRLASDSLLETMHHCYVDVA